MRRYYHKRHAPDPRQRHPRARSTCYPCAQSVPSLHRTAIRGEGEPRRPLSSFPRSKACPVPRYGARIHALTPRGKMSIANPGTTNAVNVARGLVPRYGLPPAGNRSDEPPGPPTNTNDPRRGGFQTRLGRRKMATPAGRPLRHSVAPTSSFPRRACPVPRYGAGIHAPKPHRKTSIERPGITNKVNVARGLVPRYGLPPAGNRYDEPSGPKRTSTIPVEAGFKPAWGGGRTGKTGRRHPSQATRISGRAMIPLRPARLEHPDR